MLLLRQERRRREGLNSREWRKFRKYAPGGKSALRATSGSFLTERVSTGQKLWHDNDDVKINGRLPETPEDGVCVRARPRVPMRVHQRYVHVT